MTMRPGGDARPFINVMVQADINRKEAKNYPLVLRKYCPNFSKRPMATKFYAHHEQFEESLVREDWVDWIRSYDTGIPRDRLCATETANQEYGWDLDPLVPLDKCDKKFYMPKIGCDITFVGALIALQDANLPPKKFLGIPFRLV